MKFGYIAAAAATVLVASASSAQAAVITSLDGSQGVFAPASEMYANSTIAITASTALSANGSLAFTGGRGRVINGNNYTPNMNFGAANALVSLTGDYLVYNGGANGGIQSPAFRVYIQDGAQRSELIWEAANNGGYILGQAGTTGSAGLFWQNIAGSGPTLVNGGYVLRTVAEWGSLYSANAFISAFGVGFGGDAGADFSALADNVVLTTTTGSQGYDFSAGAAVPEPATWAMMMLGFGAMGAAMRRRTTRARIRFA